MADNDKAELARRFFALFEGLDRSKGEYHPPSNGRAEWMKTTRVRPSEIHVLDHLEGTLGLGITPLRDDGTAKWGAIDIDAHEEGSKIDLEPLCAKIESLSLPLVVCSSKSQGAHLYLFLKEPLPVKAIRDCLARWAAILGHGGCEVFPKQGKLGPDSGDGKPGVGNWINLPYFDCDDTIRFAQINTKEPDPLSIEEFLDLAESKRVGAAELQAIKPPDDLAEAPPCVEYLLTHGVTEGSRNNALFQIGNFYKKRGESDVEAALLEVNYNKGVLKKPLPPREVKTIAMSINRNDYPYRCNEAPMCDHCDKSACLGRKFGVKDGPQKAFSTTLYGGLAKINTDPPIWQLEVNEVPIDFPTEGLINYGLVKPLIIAKLNIMPPPWKNEDWQLLMRKKLESVVHIDAPDDAGPGATIIAMLDEYLFKVFRRSSDGSEKFGVRMDLLRGQPVLEKDPKSDGYIVFFRGPDFIQFLKRRKAEEKKGADLWSILRKAGCEHQKVRVGRTVKQLWLKRFAEFEEDKFETPRIESKI